MQACVKAHIHAKREKPEKVREVRKERSHRSRAWLFTPTKATLPDFPRADLQREKEEKLQLLHKSIAQGFNETVLCDVEKM